MTYELAKQLKDAGLEQEGFGKRRHDPECKLRRGLTDLCTAYVPTLSELISACWKDSHNFRLDYVQVTAKWAACTNWGNGYEDNGCDGNSPEEATARLWLLIHNENVSDE